MVIATCSEAVVRMMTGNNPFVFFTDNTERSRNSVVQRTQQKIKIPLTRKEYMLIDDVSSRPRQIWAALPRVGPARMSARHCFRQMIGSPRVRSGETGG